MKRRYKIALWIMGSLCSMCLVLWITAVIWYLQSGAGAGLLVGNVTTGHSQSWMIPEGITYFYVMDTQLGKRQLEKSREPLMALAISSVLGTSFTVAKPKRLIATWTRLLDAGQPIDRPVPNANGLTALSIAALSGKPDLVQFLLSHGANPNYFQLIHWQSNKKKTKVTILDQTTCFAKIFPKRDYGPVLQLLVKAIKSRGDDPDFAAAQRYAKHCRATSSGNE